MMLQERPVALVPSSVADASTPSAASARSCLDAAIRQVNAVVLGKASQVRLAFVCLLTGGHLLLEDLPGTGKTLLAKSLGSALGLSFHRIQFTSDLMPSDILGVSVYRPDTRQFELHQGPIFTQVLLADEINRASPRTQSALLEAMAEGQVSIDRQTLKLPTPFMVLATQNPIDTVGTFPLPAAQLDRFLFQVSLGYPDRQSELELMRPSSHPSQPDGPSRPAPLSAANLATLRAETRQVVVAECLLAYAYNLVHATRTHPSLQVGLSPRAALALVAAGQALAFIANRDYATPEDIQEAFLPLATHRVHAKAANPHQARDILADILRQTAI